MDYYSILGVPRNASESDLKKAYKQASMKHHPDRGGDAEQFKKVSEAYGILKDPQKRAAYDNPQRQYHANTGNMQGGHSFDDIFANFGFMRPGQPMRNKDMRIGYRMSFAEVYTGCAATITYNLPNGRGEVIDAKIPPGMKHGDTVQFPNYGDDSIPGIPRGTLQVQLAIPTPHKWKRDGEHLYTEVIVDIFDLILGKSVTIHTPENKQLALTVPPGTNNDVTMNITGHGLPRVNTYNNRGNLYVKIKAVTPKLTNDELRRIEEIKNGINLRTQ